MPMFVESVRPAWRVCRGGPWDFLGGEFWGRLSVGARVVEWVLNDDDSLTVRHPGCRGLLAALVGVPIEPQRYRVAVVKAPAAHGGERTWWSCPGCGRRCGLLYLVPGRDRLGCRVCCRLVYRSQYEQRARALRRRGRARGARRRTQPNT
ncbi:MAG: hypothetical protein U0804_24140 [Gemmataceae bacterium]